MHACCRIVSFRARQLITRCHKLVYFVCVRSRTGLRRSCISVACVCCLLLGGSRPVDRISVRAWHLAGRAAPPSACLQCVGQAPASWLRSLHCVGCILGRARCRGDLRQNTLVPRPSAAREPVNVTFSLGGLWRTSVLANPTVAVPARCLQSTVVEWQPSSAPCAQSARGARSHSRALMHLVVAIHRPRLRLSRSARFRTAFPIPSTPAIGHLGSILFVQNEGRTLQICSDKGHGFWTTHCV